MKVSESDFLHTSLAFDYADIEDKSQVATFWAISGVLTLQYETFKEPGTRECREYDDGCDYTGRGALMLKGSSEYREAGRDLKRNYGSDPESVLQPADAFLSAGWLWKKRDMHDFGDHIGVVDLIASAVKFQIYSSSDREQMEVTYRRALECLEKDTTCTWYVVSKYDTPRIIADSLGYDLDDLVALNNWSGPNQALTEGESIKLSCHSS